MRTFAYPAIFEPGDDPSVIVVTFPDVPEAITEGSTEAEAREMAAEALGLALRGILQAGRPLPVPFTARASGVEGRQVTITPPADDAAKIAVIEAFREAGMTQKELGARLGIDAKDVRRLLDPDHATKLPRLQAALGAMGQRLVVGVEAA